jgi:uncharacterized repeat protein (TIGR01451 family)
MTRTASVRAALAMLVIGGVVLLNPAPASAQGSVLVNETFTGATADPRFEAFGSACLTGAPGGAAPGPGAHDLTSCSATPVGPAPPRNGAPFGYLQLTDAANDEAGAVLFNQPLPANEGLQVTFEQWQYGATTVPPADGISFFLVDGAGGLTAPGAFGGSLGYAQKLNNDDPTMPFEPGVDNGYLGIGFDVLGNYFGDWEQRSNGCPADQRSPAGPNIQTPAPGQNMVTVRGPGNGILGYCFLTATTSNFTTTGPWPSTLPGQLQGPTTAVSADPATAQADLEPSKRTVRVRISPAPNPQITVDIDFNDGNGFQQVLSFPAPEPVPPTYKFGFAASTGQFTDVHLIRNVTVESLLPLPALNLVKQVSIDPPLPPVLGVGAQVPYEFVVTNTGGSTITNLAVSDPTVGPVSCPTTTLTPMQTTVCTATYTVTAADVSRGFIRNVAVANGTGPSGPVTSPESEVTLPLGGRVSLDLTKETDTSRTYQVGDTVEYTYVVTNISEEVVEGLQIQDDRVSGIVCESTTLQPVTNPGANSTVCRGSYTITAADAASGSVTNTAQAIGNGGEVVSPPATVTVQVGPAPPTPPASPSPGLPVTGAPLVPTLAGASVLVGAGVAVLLLTPARRRHQ